MEKHMYISWVYETLELNRIEQSQHVKFQINMLFI